MRTFASEPHFITGLYNSEDLAPIPDTRWMIASGMDSIGHPAGHLYMVDVDAKTASEVFPERTAWEPDVATYGDVARPDIDTFCGHGVALRPGADGTHTLYVVNHGGRESIEVFTVDASGDGEPTLTWVGAVIQDTGVWGNAVAPLPDGGIVVTNYLDLGDPTAADKVLAGEVTGNLKEWHTGEGWTDVPGSEICAPNGVEVSPDGRWYFVCSWSPKQFARISRGMEPVQRDVIDVDFLADNVKWSADDTLLVAGQRSTAEEVFLTYTDIDIGNFPVAVVEIDPETLAVRDLVRLEHEIFGCASTGIYVGDDLWVGSARSDRIAWFTPAP